MTCAPQADGTLGTVDLAGSKASLPAVVSGGAAASAARPFAAEQPWRGPAHVVLPRQPRLCY